MLASQAADCRRCDLFERATATVFGEGNSRADLVLVGEQPGDVEDRTGKPFVGPAGHLLDKALEEAGIERRRTYVTNAVKHFKWEERGKRRLHKRPNRTEVVACHIWLEEELAAIDPAVVVALGVVAGSSLIGPGFRLKDFRGVPTVAEVGEWQGPVLSTIHPSALLRAPRIEARRSGFSAFVGDLERAGELASS